MGHPDQERSLPRGSSHRAIKPCRPPQSVHCILTKPAPSGWLNRRLQLTLPRAHEPLRLIWSHFWRLSNVGCCKSDGAFSSTILDHFHRSFSPCEGTNSKIARHKALQLLFHSCESKAEEKREKSTRYAHGRCKERWARERMGLPCGAVPQSSPVQSSHAEGQVTLRSAAFRDTPLIFPDHFS